MEKILGKIYTLFESLYGIPLAEYLWGFDCNKQEYVSQNIFNIIGLFTLIVTLVLVLAYYYLPLWGFNHPRTNRWWNWLIILIIAGLINFLIAYEWVVNDFLDNKIGDCLVYTFDENGQNIQQINKENCMLFGFSNFFISSFFFIMWSFIFKWFSPNCKYSPWPNIKRHFINNK